MASTESVETPTEKPLTPEDIRAIAEIVWEQYGKKAMMPNHAVPIVSGVMRNFGCTQKQIDTQRIEVSRAILQVRSEQ